MRLILIGSFSLALAAPAIAAHGQTPPGVLRGVVFDSLITGRPLEGAEVWIESTNRMARSDAAGNFVLGAVPPGRYLLTFYHPMLDSAGVFVPPVMVDVASDSSTNVKLATPSPEQAHRLLCRRDPLRQTGSIVGMIRNAASGKPIAAATVTVHWTTYDVSEGWVRGAPRSVQANSDSSGHVLLCGLPTDVALVVRGRSNAGAAGMAMVDLAGRPFARADLQLAAQSDIGTIEGVVRTRNGSLVPGATVAALGTDATARTDEFGRFNLEGVAAGSGILEAHAMGYMPGHTMTSVRPGSVQQVEILIGDSVAVLAPVSVEGKYEPYLARVGYVQRKLTALGHFLDTTDIRRSGASRFEEVFRMVPGVKLRPNGSGFLIELQRGEGQIWNPTLGNYCPPLYFIDGVGFRLPPTQTPSVPIVPAEILAIEVYSNVFSAPPQYQRRDGACGVILVWTKRGVPKTRASQ